MKDENGRPMTYWGGLAHDAGSGSFKKHAELEACVKEFFEKYLNRVEESDSGKEFHPVTIGCCRAHMLEPLNNLLDRMAELSGAEKGKTTDCSGLTKEQWLETFANQIIDECCGVLFDMHERAKSSHNYYGHAVIELKRYFNKENT